MESELGNFRQASVRMSVELPRSAVRTVPDTQGVVTKHDRLTVDRNFRQIVVPGEFLFQLASLFVVISGHGKDLLTADPATVCDNACVASHTEVAQKVEDVIRFHRGVKAFENCLIHLSDSREGPTAKADDVGVSKMEIGGEPCVWHSLRPKVEVSPLSITDGQSRKLDRPDSSSSGSRAVPVV